MLAVESLEGCGQISSNKAPANTPNTLGYWLSSSGISHVSSLGDLGQGLDHPLIHEGE
jgi:hypothetical protein